MGPWLGAALGLVGTMVTAILLLVMMLVGHVGNLRESVSRIDVRGTITQSEVTTLRSRFDDLRDEVRGPPPPAWQPFLFDDESGRRGRQTPPPAP